MIACNSKSITITLKFTNAQLKSLLESCDFNSSKQSVEKIRDALIEQSEKNYYRDIVIEEIKQIALEIL